MKSTEDKARTVRIATAVKALHDIIDAEMIGLDSVDIRGARTVAEEIVRFVATNYPSGWATSLGLRRPLGIRATYVALDFEHMPAITWSAERQLKLLLPRFRNMTYDTSSRTLQVQFFFDRGVEEAKHASPPPGEVLQALPNHGRPPLSKALDLGGLNDRDRGTFVQLYTDVATGLGQSFLVDLVTTTAEEEHYSIAFRNPAFPIQFNFLEALYDRYSLTIKDMMLDRDVLEIFLHKSAAPQHPGLARRGAGPMRRILYVHGAASAGVSHDPAAVSMCEGAQAPRAQRHVCGSGRVMSANATAGLYISIECARMHTHGTA